MFQGFDPGAGQELLEGSRRGGGHRTDRSLIEYALPLEQQKQPALHDCARGQRVGIGSVPGCGQRVMGRGAPRGAGPALARRQCIHDHGPERVMVIVAGEFQQAQIVSGERGVLAQYA